MNEQARTQPPEGSLIAAALKRSTLSQRAAAKKAGISDVRWRQIVAGYERKGGMDIPVQAPPETLARMARTVGVTPDQLVQAGRQDAADELRAIIASADKGVRHRVIEAALEGLSAEEQEQVIQAYLDGLREGAEDAPGESAV